MKSTANASSTVPSAVSLATSHWLNSLKNELKDWFSSEPTREELPNSPTTQRTAGPQALTQRAAAQQMLGQYFMDEARLGIGGYAKVVMGRHVKTGQSVAIKLLSSTPVATEGRGATSRAAVVREVAALRRAGQHENVCKLFDYYHLGHDDALVLELCRGGELFGLIERQGALSEEVACEVFRGVLSGMQHLHAVGIAHRDLKLENILLGGHNDRVPKICDLGLAHVYSHSPDGCGWANEELTQFCGSRSYCAPEVMARRGYDGHAVDCWCLGVCLFGLVAGFFPVDEASTRDWRFVRVAQQQCLEPSQSTCSTIFGFYNRSCPFSPGLIALCDGLLQVQPVHRANLAVAASSAWVLGSDQRGLSVPAQAEISARLPATDAECAAGKAAAPIEIVDFDEEVFRSVGEGEGFAKQDYAGCEREPPALCRQRAVVELEHMC